MRVLSLVFCLLLLFVLTNFSTVHAQTKPYPSNFSRHWMCPNYVTKMPTDYLPSIPFLNDVPVQNTLAQIVPEVSNISNAAVILVKRLPGGAPRFKYFGNGHQNFAIETWSCSKIFSAMNGAGHMGSVCPGEKPKKHYQDRHHRADASTKAAGFSGGLAQSTQGDYGATPLGDLVTIIVTYDTTHPPYSSNALGGWFEMLGGRARALHLVQNWMNRSDESLGANYGNSPPTDLQFSDFVPSGCAIVPDTPDNGDYSNTLSALTMAEFVKRIVMARELPGEAFPNTTWNDSVVLLYGAEQSKLFPGMKWGGMSANSDDYLRIGINITEADVRSDGQYRTFSKDGAGYSYIRDAAEVTFNGYACYPSLNHPEEGVEYFISTRLSIPGEDSPALIEKVFTTMRSVVGKINEAIYSGRLV